MKIYGRTFDLEVKTCHGVAMRAGGVAGIVAAVASALFAYQGTLPPLHIGTATLIAGGTTYIAVFALSVLGVLSLGVGVWLTIKIVNWC